jgi:hypothetical protein
MANSVSVLPAPPALDMGTSAIIYAIQQVITHEGTQKLPICLLSCAGLGQQRACAAQGAGLQLPLQLLQQSSKPS